MEECCLKLICIVLVLSSINLVVWLLVLIFLMLDRDLFWLGNLVFIIWVIDIIFVNVIGCMVLDE